MFCRKCGNQLPDDARFCDNCGAKVERSETIVNTGEKIPGKAPLDYGKDVSDPRLIGFSHVCTDPAITEFKEKKKKSSGGCMMSLALTIPVVVFAMGLIGMFTGENDISDALFITCLSLVPAALFLIISFVQKANAKREKPSWEGVIVSKEKEKVRDYHKEKHNSEGGKQYYTIYTFHARTDDGQDKKFSKSDEPALYGYYNEGDRIKYHPVLEYYEKYDKSHDKYIFCACCGCRNQIGNNVCSKCGMPLFK